MEISVFLTVFTLIFVAELPDKTALAVFLMATRGKALPIFAGVAAAFFIQCLIAVSFGSLLGLLPEKWVHTGAGLLFIGFAIHTWFFHDKEAAETEKETPVLSTRTKFRAAAWKAFLVIFIAEWGDMTQLATASFAARFHEHPVTVFLGATTALCCVAGLAVLAGKKIGHVVHVDILKKVSTVLFAVVGISFIVSAWH
ncbi:MAG: TMEM165/GDT1 family protein [Pseudomonadota bacterium]